MSLQVLQAIGDTLNTLNPGVFDTYHVNGIRLTDGRVIKFDDNKEKAYIGIADNVGTSFYIRSEASISIAGRKLSSITRPAQESKTCRLVAFSFTGVHESEALCNKLKTDLSKLQFRSFSGNKPVITVKKSNSHYIDNFLEESLKNFSGGDSFLCVSIDFEIKYSAAECDTCEPVDPDSIYVLIIDQDGNIIARKTPPSEYPVLVFDGINDTGPPYTFSIVDNG